MATEVAKRYEKIPHATFRPVRLNGNAFDVARERYSRYEKHDFAEDLIYYLRHGFVVSRPTVFAMGRPVEYNGRYGWYLQMCAGNILELLTCLPYKLDFLAFDRDNEGKIRVVDLDWFINKVARKKAVQS
jgi:hypothetical protein